MIAAAERRTEGAKAGHQASRLVMQHHCHGKVHFGQFRGEEILLILAPKSPSPLTSQYKDIEECNSG